MSMAAPHAGPESEVLERHGGGVGGRLTFSVVTPAGQAAQGVIDEVTAPGLIGEFGVLPGHVPLLAALKAGVLTWRDGSGRHVLAVDKGYLQIGAANRVIVLVEKALKPESIDVPEAREAAAKHAEQLKQGNMEPAQLEVTRLALEWAQARVETAERVSGGGDKPGAH